MVVYLVGEYISFFRREEELRLDIKFEISSFRLPVELFLRAYVGPFLSCKWGGIGRQAKIFTTGAPINK